MKCPVCGQWNRASNPRCMKCGSFLTPPKGSDGEPAWRESVKDGQRGTEYYRMDEYGESDAKPDARDTLAEICRIQGDPEAEACGLISAFLRQS